MGSSEFAVRLAMDYDRRALALLLAEVAEERDGIAAEPPIDVDQLAASWSIDGTQIAEAQGSVIGEIRVDPSLDGLRRNRDDGGGAVAWSWRRNSAGSCGHRMGAIRWPPQTGPERVSP